MGMHADAPECMFYSFSVFISMSESNEYVMNVMNHSSLTGCVRLYHIALLRGYESDLLEMEQLFGVQPPFHRPGSLILFVEAYLLQRETLSDPVSGSDPHRATDKEPEQEKCLYPITVSQSSKTSVKHPQIPRTQGADWPSLVPNLSTVR